MNPNIKEIGNVIKQMQVVGGTVRSPNLPEYNKAAADIVKQGIDQKREEKKWTVPVADNKNPLN